MTATIEYRTVDKTDWGPGPWASEPDKRQWQDADTGLPCLIVRGPSGALCGYVGVSPDHPAHGFGYDHWSTDEDGEPVPLTPIQSAINDIEVHGGLTYADGCGHGPDPAKGICHIASEGEPDHVWWFGFDCCHSGDVSPSYARRYSSWPGEVYRDQVYVEGQVRSLARQLAALADAPKASPQPAAVR